MAARETSLVRRAGVAERPRLRARLPVLRRGEHEVQIGLGAGGVVLGGVPIGTEAVLQSFDGRHSLDELRAVAVQHGLDPRTPDRLVDALAGSGLLSVDSAGTPQDSSATVRMIGAGRIGRAIGLRLLDLAVVGVIISDPADADRHLYPDAQLADSRADALVRLLRQRRDRTGSQLLIEVGPPWHALDSDPALGTRGGPSFTVLTAEEAEVDRARSDLLLRRDETHLVVTARPDAIVVGPLVRPGRTACLNCLDLTRRQIDPAWPQLLAQLVRLPSDPSALATDWAATCAVLQIEAWLASGQAETVGATLELSEVGRQLTRHPWRMQPGCGCAWPTTARWEA